MARNLQYRFGALWRQQCGQCRAGTDGSVRRAWPGAVSQADAAASGGHHSQARGLIHAHPAGPSRARRALSAGRHLGRAGRQLRRVLRQCRRASNCVCSIPAACGRSRASICPNTPTRSGTAICPMRCRGWSMAIAPMGPYRAAARPPLQSAQIAARSLCPRLCREISLDRCAVRLSRALAARRSQLRPPRQRPGHAESRGRPKNESPRRDDTRPYTPWSETVIYEAHLRGLTKLLEEVNPPERGTFAALSHPRVIRHLQRSGRHGDRTAAGPRLPAGPLAAGAEPFELLGLQHARLLRAGAALSVDRGRERNAHGDPPAACAPESR